MYHTILIVSRKQREREQARARKKAGNSDQASKYAVSSKVLPVEAAAVGTDAAGGDNNTKDVDKEAVVEEGEAGMMEAGVGGGGGVGVSIVQETVPADR